MQAHQKRVVEEKNELDEKRGRLESFLAGATFKGLPQDEQERLARQARIMGDYSAVLGERIAAFKGSVVSG